MTTFFFWMSIGFSVGVITASLFEWTLHRYIMHRPFGKFRYPYERHALVHHRIFKADHTYHLINESDKKTIPMAWWNGPVLIAVGMLPFLAIALWFQKWGFLCGAALASTAYYTAYEYNVGVAYNGGAGFQLTGSGGSPPYTWDIVANALPPGLGLSSSGLISGRPTSAATFDFTVRMTDTGARPVQRDLAITIHP